MIVAFILNECLLADVCVLGGCVQVVVEVMQGHACDAAKGLKRNHLRCSMVMSLMQSDMHAWHHGSRSPRDLHQAPRQRRCPMLAPLRHVDVGELMVANVQVWNLLSVLMV